MTARPTPGFHSCRWHGPVEEHDPLPHRPLARLYRAAVESDRIKAAIETSEAKAEQDEIDHWAAVREEEERRFGRLARLVVAARPDLTSPDDAYDARREDLNRLPLFVAENPSTTQTTLSRS